MIRWIKRGAGIFGAVAFFAALICMLIHGGPMQLTSVAGALIVASVAGLVFWFFGAVVSDIVIKGMVTDLGDPGVDALLDGGIVQRLHTMHERLLPGGSEMPYTNVKKADKSSDNKKKRKK